MSEWISVDDRLPVDGLNVLVYLPDNIYELQFVVQKISHGLWYVQEEWHSDTVTSSGDNPTHWQPLPTPPTNKDK